MKLRTRREKVLAAVVVMLGVFFFAGRYFLYPLMDETTAMRDEISGLEKDIERTERLIERYAAAAPETAARRKRYAVGGSPEALMSDLQSRITAAAQEAGVSVLEQTSRGVRDEEFYLRLLWRVTTEGSVTETMRFIYDLQAADPALDVEEVSLRQTMSAADRNNLRAEFALSRVFLPEM